MRFFSIGILLLLMTVCGFSQSSEFSKDRIKVGYGVTLGFVPVILSGTMDVGSGNSTTKGNTVITSAPVYKNVNRSIFLATCALHLDLNLPFYSTENWSAGVRLQAGGGFHVDIKDPDEGFTSYFFNFPQFLYYRNYQGFDFSILAGYKHTYGIIPYNLMVLGIDLNSGFDSGDSIVRFYVSPFSYKYYTLYTNGKMSPAIRIYEVGVALISYF